MSTSCRKTGYLETMTSGEFSIRICGPENVIALCLTASIILRASLSLEENVSAPTPAMVKQLTNIEMICYPYNPPLEKLHVSRKGLL